MSEEFNPYLKWLGIPAKHLPANHYRLLGLELFEADPDVIESAADRQMAHVRTFRTGKRVEAAEKLLNELSEARIVLLNAQKKAEYDGQLRAKEQEIQKQEARKKEAASPSNGAAPAKKRAPVATALEDEPAQDQAEDSARPAVPRPKAIAPPTRAPLATPVAASPPPATAGQGPMVLGASTSTASRARRRQQPPWVALGALGAIVLIVLIAGALVLPGLLTEPLPVADAGDDSTTAQNGSQGSGSTTGVNQTGGSSSNTTTGNDNSGTTRPNPQGNSGNTSTNNPGSGTNNGSNTSSGNTGSTNTSTGGSKDPDDDEDRNPPPRDPRDPLEEPDDDRDPPSDPDDMPPRTGDLSELINNPDKPPKNPPDDSDDDPITRPAKIAAPGAAAQATIEAHVKDLYPLNNKATIDEQRQTAKKLIDDGSAVKDNSDEQFVMIRMGAEMAATAGQLEAAMGAMDVIDQQFAGDTSALRLKMVEHASRAVVPLEEKQAIFQAMLPVLDAAIASNKFSEVDALVTTLLAAARKLNNKELNLALVERRKTATALAAQYAKAKDALETLKDSPDDPQANLIVGSFLAFAKEDWEKGLTHLAKGSDQDLADLAQRELKKPTAGSDLAKLGDGWYARAQKEEQPAKGAMLARAEAHYQQALPDVTGLVKAGIEKRLAELASAAAATRPKQPVSHMARIVAVGDSDFEMYLNGKYLMRSEGGGFGRDSGIQEVTQELKPGDILTVKSTNRRDEKGFACVIKWEQGDRAIATGAGGWQVYLPGNLQTWYDPAGIKSTGAPQLGDTDRHQRVIEATGVRCQPIWGPIPFAATFALQIPQ